jgi:hypothetical protein
MPIGLESRVWRNALESFTITGKHNMKIQTLGIKLLAFQGKSLVSLKSICMTKQLKLIPIKVHTHVSATATWLFSILFWIISKRFNWSYILHSSNTWEKMGIQWGSASAIFKLQESSVTREDFCNILIWVWYSNETSKANKNVSKWNL